MRAVAVIVVTLIARVAAAEGDAALWQYEPGTVALIDTTAGQAVPDTLAARARQLIRAYVESVLHEKLVALKPDKKHRQAAARRLRDIATCPDNPCRPAAFLATELRAETVVTSDLRTSRNGFTLMVVTFDGRTGKVTARISRELYSAGEIEQTALDLTHEAFKTEPRDHMGYIRLFGAVGAHVSVDGQDVVTTPVVLPIRLTEGTHLLHVDKPGFYPLNRDVEVVRGDEVQLRVKLAAMEGPPPLAVAVLPKTLPDVETLSEKSSPVEVVVPVRPSPPMTGTHRAGWAMGAIGLATLAAGLGVGISANMHESHLKSTVQLAGAVQSEMSAARAQAIAADVMFGVSGGLGAAGLCLVVVF